MAVAPELFARENALSALSVMQSVLLGMQQRTLPVQTSATLSDRRLCAGNLGMKTLDPSDFWYRGQYQNANDSDDISVAHGFNYHQVRSTHAHNWFRRDCGRQRRPRGRHRVPSGSGPSGTSFARTSYSRMTKMPQCARSVGATAERMLRHLQLSASVLRCFGGQIWSWAAPHAHEISTSAWMGLPELTQADGALCPDSCPTQVN